MGKHNTSRKTRPPRDNTSGTRSTLRPDRSTSSVPSRDWSDLDSPRRDVFDPPQAATRPQPQRLVRSRPPIRAVLSSAKAHPGLWKALQRLFGGWELPTPPARLANAPEAFKRVADCARRHNRREVLFARRLTGKGSGKFKKHYTNRSCK